MRPDVSRQVRTHSWLQPTKVERTAVNEF